MHLGNHGEDTCLIAGGILNPLKPLVNWPPPLPSSFDESRNFFYNSLASMNLFMHLSSIQSPIFIDVSME